jgi:hypothetical protein
MATSGTSAFSQTSREIITQALYVLHEVALGDTPEADQAEQARIVLNQMIKTWGAAGRLWLMEEGSIPLIASTASYELPLARKVHSVRRRTDDVDTPLMPISRSDYDDLPTKSATGMPIQWFFDPQRATKTLFVWNAPDTATAASTTLEYTYSRVIEDVQTLDEDVDVPQEWLEALTYGLAKRLGPHCALPTTSPILWGEIKEMAERLYMALASDDQESASILVSPDLYY